MPNVKIELQPGETPDEAENLLFKAFEAQRNGDIHGEEYHDPAMRDTFNRMQEVFKREQTAMLEEIFRALDEEHQSDGNI